MKLSIKLAVISWALCSASLAVAASSGGSLVGNGAGLAEMEITYAYSVRLQPAIDLCLAAPADCDLSDREQQALRQIREILMAQPNAEQKLHYMSENELPGFFNTGEGEHHRIAKTDTRTHSIIFINRDALYRNGKAIVDMPLAASILVHELGHQVGIPDHTWLDALGSKIRNILQRTKIKIEHPKETIDMTVYTGSGTFAFFLNNNLSSIDLSQRAYAALTCPYGTQVTRAYVSNYAWNISQKMIPYQFSAMIRYECGNSKGLHTRPLVQLTFNVPTGAGAGKTKLMPQNIGLTILNVE